MKTLVLAGAVIALATGSAFAADISRPVYKAAPAPVSSWTGCYVGAGGGYGMYDLDTKLASRATGAVVNVPIDQGGRGWFGTVQIGCDYQLSGAWVIGAFADADWSRIRGKHTGGDFAIGLVSADMKLTRSWAAGARLGYIVTPSLLTYVSAGFTEAKFGQANYAAFNGVLTGLSVPAQTYSGYFIGGGTEYALGFFPGVFWKTEYRFADYRTRDLTVFVTATGAPNGILERTHPYVQTLRSELVWRFNMGDAVRAAY
ncbi:MAG: outer rane immunogenic protein [Alphaproteobacteria bacterium]|jgi:outer membrane immunogenic protein|nr:outer rane immunogenic protein [Alphaproteobacteria bacterium]